MTEGCPHRSLKEEYDSQDGKRLKSIQCGECARVLWRRPGVADPGGSVGFRLRYFRQTAKLTQGDVGRLGGFPEQQVCHWEAGRRTPNLANLRRLARVLGLSLGDFLGEE